MVGSFGIRKGTGFPTIELILSSLVLVAAVSAIIGTILGIYMVIKRDTIERRIAFESLLTYDPELVMKHALYIYPEIVQKIYKVSSGKEVQKYIDHQMAAKFTLEVSKPQQEGQLK